MAPRDVICNSSAIFRHPGTYVVLYLYSLQLMFKEKNEGLLLRKNYRHLSLLHAAMLLVFCLRFSASQNCHGIRYIYCHLHCSRSCERKSKQRFMASYNYRYVFLLHPDKSLFFCFRTRALQNCHGIRYICCHMPLSCVRRRKRFMAPYDDRYLFLLHVAVSFFCFRTGASQNCHGIRYICCHMPLSAVYEEERKGLWLHVITGMCFLCMLQ